VVGTLIHCWWDCKLVHIRKRYGGSSKKLKIELPFLGIYPKDYESGYNKDTCTSIFIAVFTIAKLWKQPRCLQQ
jgi:hypothetical protein